MICEYCIVGDYLGFCQCSKSGDICPFMRRCNLEHKWLPLTTMDRCNIRLGNDTMFELKKDEYKVAFESKGMLYVEYGDNVFKFKNPFDDVPQKVQLVRVDNELYIKGFEPIKEEVKTEEKVPKKESRNRKRNK